MKKAILLVVMALVAVLVQPAHQPVQAQGAIPIAYGEVLAGDISAGSIFYSFTAQEGEFAAVQLIPKFDAAVIGADIIVTSPSGTELGNSAKSRVFRGVGEVVVAEIVETGEHTIEVALSNSGKAGSYELILNQAIEIPLDSNAQGEAVSSPSREYTRYSTFFIVRSTTPVNITYTFTGGTYAPFVVVHSLDAGNTLNPIAYLGGTGLDGGSMTVAGDPMFQIITVGSSDLGQLSYEEPGSATFTLEVAAAN
ncbi:MAG: hypothetical protein OHK0023_18050 [Anaerolineae bacterium]